MMTNNTDGFQREIIVYDEESKPDILLEDNPDNR